MWFPQTFSTRSQNVSARGIKAQQCPLRVDPKWTAFRQTFRKCVLIGSEDVSLKRITFESRCPKIKKKCTHMFRRRFPRMNLVSSNVQYTFAKRVSKGNQSRATFTTDASQMNHVSTYVQKTCPPWFRRRFLEKNIISVKVYKNLKKNVLTLSKDVSLRGIPYLAFVNVTYGWTWCSYEVMTRDGTTQALVVVSWTCITCLVIHTHPALRVPPSPWSCMRLSSAHLEKCTFARSEAVSLRGNPPLHCNQETSSIISVPAIFHLP